MFATPWPETWTPIPIPFRGVLGRRGSGGISASGCPSCSPEREREFFIDNLLVRIHLIIMMIRGPVSRHGSLNSLFQVALHLPPCSRGAGVTASEPRGNTLQTFKDFRLKDKARIWP